MEAYASDMRLASTAIATLVAGCSLLIPAEPEVVYCRDSGHIGAPACEANHVCADGICQQCSVREACGDNVDNDCDGEIDDECPLHEGGNAGQAGAGSR